MGNKVLQHEWPKDAVPYLPSIEFPNVVNQHSSELDAIDAIILDILQDLKEIDEAFLLALVTLVDPGYWDQSCLNLFELKFILFNSILEHDFKIFDNCARAADSFDNNRLISWPLDVVALLSESV